MLKLYNSMTRKKEEFGRSYMIANMRDIMMKKEAFKDGLKLKK